MTHVFLYGTLLNLELLEIVLGRKPDGVAAVLPDCRAAWVAGREFPMVYRCDGGRAEGYLLEADAQDIARMDFYEGPFSYDLEAVEVVCDGDRVAAQTYFPTPGRYEPGEDWNIADWTNRHGALRLIAAQEIMDRFGVMSAEEVDRRYPVILARAQQKLNAVTSPSPQNLRVKNDAQHIEVKSKIRDHDNWFLMEEFDLTHPKYDGTQSREIKRAVFVMADAVTVLPYDPVQDTVLLIEQFRAGVFRRGDPHPWSLEAIAGRIDGGETAEDAAFREAKEETGLTLRRLEKINSYYASPGAATEYLTSYIGLADLGDFEAGTGGLTGEDEDIRSMIVPFERLMEAVRSGEAENAPLLISALWLAANRDRLRANG
jgi:nudix-type nucleoside diphosphatase (YffH/AdpP family)